MGCAHRPGARLRHVRWRSATPHRSDRRHHPAFSPPIPRRPSVPVRLLQIELAHQVGVVEEGELILPERLLPGLLVPDTHHVDLAREHHVSRQVGGLPQELWEQDPTLRIERALVRARHVEVLEADQTGVEAVLGEDPFLELPPGRERVDVETTPSPHPELGNHEALLLEPGERLAEADRDGHPPLGVDRVIVVTPKHPAARGELPPHPRLHHFSPQLPTTGHATTPERGCLSRKTGTPPSSSWRARARAW